VWRACRLNTTKALRKVLEDVVQGEVRLSTLQEFDDLFTNRIVHRHHLTLNEELLHRLGFAIAVLCSL
jgi:hypothetical protein